MAKKTLEQRTLDYHRARNRIFQDPPISKVESFDESRVRRQWNNKQKSWVSLKSSSFGGYQNGLWFIIFPSFLCLTDKLINSLQEPRHPTTPTTTWAPTPTTPTHTNNLPSPRPPPATNLYKSCPPARAAHQVRTTFIRGLRKIMGWIITESILLGSTHHLHLRNNNKCNNPHHPRKWCPHHNSSPRNTSHLLNPPFLNSNITSTHWQIISQSCSSSNFL